MINPDVSHLIGFLADLTNVIIKAEADGKIDAQDLPLLFQIIPSISPAFQNISQVPAELESMSVEDQAQLVAEVVSRLALGDAKAKAVVSAALNSASALFSLYKAVKA